MIRYYAGERVTYNKIAATAKNKNVYIHIYIPGTKYRVDKPPSKTYSGVQNNPNVTGRQSSEACCAYMRNLYTNRAYHRLRQPNYPTPRYEDSDIERDIERGKPTDVFDGQEFTVDTPPPPPPSHFMVETPL